MNGTRLLLDLTPLRTSVPYRRMWLGMSLSGIGTNLTTVAVGLQVYALTGSTFRVGLVGLFALGPLLLLGLYGGAIVDAYDRRRVVVVTSSGLLVVAALIAAQAWLELENVWLLYGLVAVQNAFFAVNSPARSSIVPRLLPREQLPAANALSSLAMNIGLTLGPLLAGVLVGWAGYGAAYSVEVVLLGVAVATLVALPPIPPEGPVTKAGLASVLEGLRFLGTRPNLRMTFLVDIAAMVLAMPRVLFPAVGASIVGGGPRTVGVLVSAMAIGSIVAGVLSGRLGGVRRQGVAVLVSVVGWGVAIAGFGVVIALSPGPGPDGSASWTLWLASGFLAVAGGADAVSSVFRMTILQAAAPDAMRGRLQGVFIVVVAGGPRLGDFVVGSASHLSGEPAAAIGGGLACAAVVGLLALLQPRFARYDARDPAP